MSKINRTKQRELAFEATALEKNWKKLGDKTLTLQNRIVTMKGSLKSNRVEHNNAFKSFQKVKKTLALEKHKNDIAHFKEKAKELHVNVVSKEK